MAVHILGIRHHGPGSAKGVKSFLEELKPDIVLVEGPPEADAMLQWVSHEGLKPPVALLCYQPDEPEKSVFYPFAEFSPEWQAILYARKQSIHVRFMDLPAGNQVALNTVEDEEDAELQEPVRSPFSFFSDAAGFTDSETWWEHTFEYRVDNDDQVFDAVAEAMQAMREIVPKKEKPLEKFREAYMRKVIRQAEKEMFHTIAVICGAWHVPALQGKFLQKDDNELLKNLPKVKTDYTWIPWTFNRLSFNSGYGAGINWPGWYAHLWDHPEDDGTLWLVKVAQVFRKEKIDISVAHIIEAVRLAGSLASLRGLSRVGLEELNEAALSVLCNGEGILLDLINDELIVGYAIGDVPVDIPKPPLQGDIEKLQKKLRLLVSADFRNYTLDLRKDLDLERSLFLHRLCLMDIYWGRKGHVSGKGTFKEEWRLQWDPDFSIGIIERGNLGNTVFTAASNSVLNKAESVEDIAELGKLLEQSIPAELPEAIAFLLNKVNNMAAASADVIELMGVVPGLITVARYGNVRKTDSDMVLGIINSMISRICISLPNACVAVGENASIELLELFSKLNDGINLLQLKDLVLQWQATLKEVAYNHNTSAVIAGYATRLLNDGKQIENEELLHLFSYSMSAVEPLSAASWIEGFLKGSGTLLLLDQDLWNVINNWIAGLNEDAFIQVLPLLRRTFTNFSASERRKLGEKAKSGGRAGGVSNTALRTEFDEIRGLLGVPIVLELLGLTAKNT